PKRLQKQLGLLWRRRQLDGCDQLHSAGRYLILRRVALRRVQLSTASAPPPSPQRRRYPALGAFVDRRKGTMKTHTSVRPLGLSGAHPEYCRKSAVLDLGQRRAIDAGRSTLALLKNNVDTRR